MTHPENISISDYNYVLPDDRIASHPTEPRDKCRLLVRSRDGVLSDHLFDELPSLLPDDAMLVYNNTKVINARLLFNKSTGAEIEIFCLEPVAPSDYAMSFDTTDRCQWLCFVGNSKRWKKGRLEMSVKISNEEHTALYATRIGRRGNASVIEFEWDNDSSFIDVIMAAGKLPIPPYLNRETELRDNRDYQTVFSRISGSVAAPTAGLHFTPRLLDGIDRRGCCRRELTLHVGAGTFQPVKSETIGGHDMHSEFISVRRSLIEELAGGERPVIAVGTTSVRTLESLYHFGCMAATGMPLDELPQWFPYDAAHPQLTVREALESLLGAFDGDCFMASTRIIIAPGYRYRVVKGMVTNFHQPQSTLLLLVSAFVGDSWREMYRHALADPGYRFLSYGDACLLM